MGIFLTQEEYLSSQDIKWLKNWYEVNILPLLAPTTLDPSHPFPFIQNRGKGVFFELYSIVTVAVGLTESIIIFLVTLNELALPGLGKVKIAFVPAKFLIV